jgi:hypothetical protein
MTDVTEAWVMSWKNGFVEGKHPGRVGGTRRGTRLRAHAWPVTVLRVDPDETRTRRIWITSTMTRTNPTTTLTTTEDDMEEEELDEESKRTSGGFCAPGDRAFNHGERRVEEHTGPERRSEDRRGRR